jgi:hypothetical protein
MGYCALKGCEGLAGQLDVGKGRGGETYAETGDEDVDFLFRVRSICGGRAGGAGAVISHCCGGDIAIDAMRELRRM